MQNCKHLKHIYFDFIFQFKRTSIKEWTLIWVHIPRLQDQEQNEYQDLSQAQNIKKNKF